MILLRARVENASRFARKNSGYGMLVSGYWMRKMMPGSWFNTGHHYPNPAFADLRDL